ncbi:MAG: RnfABCDGE type electron transport complex subunit B [Deltaproteobacteria bacterium]|nr:RnfABCDGE type electron transport complex subunit B [Deltaproteobacteria bacterium]
MVVVTAVGAIGALTVLLASLLVFANKKLHVEEDPRIDDVEDMLPHANCGACGFPGCRPFAEALVLGQTNPGKCTVSSDAGRASIGTYLGMEVKAEEKRVARLACQGGTNVARNHAQYAGLKSCAAAAMVSGGGKGCFWGCLGLADCEVACTFDAITMDAHGLPVVNEDLCTACGDCVTACPKDLFSIHPVSHRLWVACRSQEAGDELLEDCEVACTACGRCAMDGPGLITMRANLPIVDYTQKHDTMLPIQRCPTGAIVWLDHDKGAVRGDAAKKIIRKGTRPDAPT